MLMQRMATNWRRDNITPPDEEHLFKKYDK